VDASISAIKKQNELSGDDRGGIMTNVINVVVTCSKDKRFPIREHCFLRHVSASTLEERMDEWQKQTEGSWNERVRVLDLYAGDHWATVKSFQSAGAELVIWVCSAGFGLLHVDDRVPPYAATFSPTHPDFVGANLGKEARSLAPTEWWRQTKLHWQDSFLRHPRSLSDLMHSRDTERFLIVASANYLSAIADDLRTGITFLSTPDNLAIVSAGTSGLEGLNDNLVPCDARMQSMVGGALRSVNTRLACRILRETTEPLSASDLKRRYATVLETLPPIQRFDRKQLSDSEISEFILSQFRCGVATSHSQLLRLLRDEGIACEQKRFASLFKRVAEAVHG
jgi:hypothetical protein